MDKEEIAFSYLPSSLSKELRKAAALYKGNISEIRLRAGRPVYITSCNRNISCFVNADYEDINATVRNLCGNSLYSYSESIKEGYICTSGGIRAGLCGRAVTEHGKIISITDITSVCIRIPHRVRGVSDPIIRQIANDHKGTLIYSCPGVGKTTMLREIAASLSSYPYNKRVAVVDTRFEICGALNGGYLIDALSGYPRAKGIETALRTLSPEYIICDEIATSDDAQAIKDCAGAGVPVIASAHAGSREELMENEKIAELINKRIFNFTVHLKRIGSRVDIEILSISGSTVLC